MLNLKSKELETIKIDFGELLDYHSQVVEFIEELKDEIHALKGGEDF